MELTNQIIFIGAMMVLVSIFASVLTSRLGAPLLLVFLVLGMLLGVDGPGGVLFDDVQLSHLLGSLALAVILLDGGLATPYEDFRVGLRPALGLATLGVAITASVTGLFAAWWLDLRWLEGLLLGAIVGSTDAAAVFSLLRSQGVELKQRVGATLEIESGSNDPMAVLLTVVLIELLQGVGGNPGLVILTEFARQMGLGALIGVSGGFALVWLLNRISMSPGLYPLAALSGGLSLFGITATLDGSGFLAIYLAGLVMGNRPLQLRLEVKRFHDGIARLAQIGMFLMLGLLVTPSELVPVAGDALLFAAVLILVARPLAVWLCLLPFRFPWREQVFLGWVGLRGAVPIILALFPLLAGLAQAQTFFNIVFFVVLISLLIQGWTVTALARALRLEVPPVTHRVQRVELDIPGQQELELVGYLLAAEAPLLCRACGWASLPGQAKLVAVVRDNRLIEPADQEGLQAGDYLYLIAEPKALPELDRLLIAEPEADYLSDRTFFGEFVLRGDIRLGDLCAVYGLDLSQEDRDLTPDALIRRALNAHPVVGDRVQLGCVELVVREVESDAVTQVGLKLPREPQREAEPT